MAWNPTGRRPDVVREIESSRDENGVAQATITLRPWTAGTRLTYEDRVVKDVAVLDYSNPDQPMRRMKPGSLSRLMMELSIVDCSGFPDVTDADGKTRPFDFRAWSHIDRLDGDVMEEVLGLVYEVCPPPGQAVKKPQDHQSPATDRQGDDGEAEAEEDDDPFPTPPTGPEV